MFKIFANFRDRFTRKSSPFLGTLPELEMDQPGKPAVSKAEFFSYIAKNSQRSVVDINREYAKLTLGPGMLTFDEYVFYRFQTNANMGMCDIFSRINAQNVVIRYEYTGLGYAGRPGGPVPTITVSLTGLNFFFLSGLLGSTPIAIPELNATMTGEDLNTSGPT